MNRFKDQRYVKPDVHKVSNKVKVKMRCENFCDQDQFRETMK